MQSRASTVRRFYGSTSRPCKSSSFRVVFVIALACISTACVTSNSALQEAQEKLATAQRDIEAARQIAEAAAVVAANARARADTASNAVNQSLQAAQASMDCCDATSGSIDRVFTMFPPPPYEQAHFLVRVFYATSRARTASSAIDLAYGTGRGDLGYGVVDVSIPKIHEIGEIERPKWWRLEFSENPDKHIVVQTLVPLTDKAFQAALGTRIKSSSRNQAFVFVHGYNVSFADAARRTAQMTVDLQFDGAPIFFSWPSRAKTALYTHDENDIAWTEPLLKDFLTALIERQDLNEIYLIAHSMGNRALAGAAVDLLREDPTARKKIREIILAAPDIDADIFKRDIAPHLIGPPSNRTPVTLYISSRDKALIASHGFHGYVRLGDVGKSPVVMDGLETIDASDVDTSFLGHGYFGDNRSVLSDIFSLVDERKRACNRFGMKRIATPVGIYCRLMP